MKDLTLRMNLLAASIVTSSFQNQGLLLIKHERSHTKNEPFGCFYCDFEFQNQGLVLRKHERSHTGNEPFGCSHCDFEFSKLRASLDEA